LAPDFQSRAAIYFFILQTETTMPITPQEALQRTIEHREIFHDEMLHIMRMIKNGE